MINGRRQPSIDGTSRMMREYQVRICEGLGVKFPGPTRHIGLTARGGSARERMRLQEQGSGARISKIAEGEPPAHWSSAILALARNIVTEPWDVRVGSSA